MSRSSRISFRRQRGGAIVETALLMLVIIPLLLYSFFLTDALYLKMDLQETVVSGTWDFSTRNEEGGSAGDVSNVETMVRAVYSDHTSAFEDGGEVGAPGYGAYDRIFGNHNHQKHHKIYFAAQYTFRFSGQDTQFKCSRSDDSMFGMGSLKGLGGQVRCEATGDIYNYIIPQRLFREFTNVKMSDMKKRTGDAHQFQGEGGQGANIVAHETAAVSFHTWALYNGSRNGNINNADIGARGFGGMGPPDSDGLFYDRVKSAYMDADPIPGPYIVAIIPASVAFMGKAFNQKLMAPAAVPYGPGSVLGLPNLAGAYLVARYKPQQPGIRQKAPGIGGMMHEGFLSTPYNRINNKYQQAYQNRGLHYMGCKQQERDKCN